MVVGLRVLMIHHAIRAIAQLVVRPPIPDTLALGNWTRKQTTGHPELLGVEHKADNPTSYETNCFKPQEN
jgi:hypothetical protein